MRRVAPLLLLVLLKVAGVVVIDCRNLRGLDSDLLLDLNVGYDVAEVLGTTVSAVGGVGLNWLDTEDVAFDVRVGAGLTYPVAEGKAIFATYTLGYDFEEENDNTELLLGVSFSF